MVSSEMLEAKTGAQRAGQDARLPRPEWWGACAEIALIVLACFVLAGTPPPDVNEAHYLAKAKHYWNPAWCPGDPFLDSADAHLVFYMTVGWLTCWMPLAAAAWTGRFLTWWLLAWSWRRLSLTIIPARWNALFTMALFAVLIRWGNMAGEWVIGGVEAKCFAYPLLFLALEALLRGRWPRAWVLLGAATAFHVLVGGWGLVALAWTWWRTSPDQRPPLRALVVPVGIAGLLALIGVGPAWLLDGSAPPEVVGEANRIYVFQRLSHHLVFHTMSHAAMARHLLLIVGWLAVVYYAPAGLRQWLAPLRPLNGFVTGAVLIAIAGVVLDQSLLYFRPLAAAVLRYYWFRLSDSLVPLVAAFTIAATLQWLGQVRPRSYPLVLGSILLILVSGFGEVVWENRSDPRPGAVIQGTPDTELSRAEKLRGFQDWQRVCQWIQERTPPGALFLTPRHQQTFKWYAQRGEVVCAKDIPQNAAGIVDWRRRMDAVFPARIRQADLAAHGETALMNLAQEYGCGYLVLDRNVSKTPLNFPRVFPQSEFEPHRYEVYVLPRISKVRP